MIGGVGIPLQALPKWAQDFSGFMPGRYAVDVLQRSEAATKTLADLRSAATHQMTIAVQRDIAAHFLPERLTDFTAKHPKVHVITRVGTADEVVGLVRARDAIVGMFLALKAVSGIRCEILDQDRLVLVAAPKHPLAEKRPVTARELAHARFVIGLRNSRFFRMTDAALKHIGVTSYDIAMEVQESNATKEMVRRGSAIACLPISAVAAELNDGSLVSLSLGSPLPQPNLYCGYMTPLSELARSLMKCLHVKTTLCA